MGTRIKVYVVVPTDRDGNPVGMPLATKLTYGAAHEIAKTNAPCRVQLYMADKTADLDISQ